MITLMMKGVFTVLASYLLIATTSIEKLCYVFRLLHIPKILVTQILLTYRYITVLLGEVNRITQAYSLRAPKQKGVHFKVWGSLSGQLLLRSMDRATMVYESMTLRGYNGESIRVEEIPVEQKTLSLVREKIGYVFQDSDSQLFMSTAYEDIAFAPRNYGFSEQEVEHRVENALKMTGIAHLKDKHIYKMSGGEKKLVSIATILSMTPDIILMDEPSIALDPKNRRNLICILNSFEHLKIIASHDLDMILDTCKRTILMRDGKIICDRPTEEILSNRRLLEENSLELPL
ncbi:ABC transporter ATP-binding protein [Blautia hominis]|uniref:ABC transporter ATP-binding protein n=2 Tax=Blautia hominis TaxID=2025493 RepID=A0ABQ0BFK3_9FIRM